MSSSSQAGSGIQFTVGSVQSEDSVETSATPSKMPVYSSELYYMMTLDDDVNAVTREDFYYDHVSQQLCHCV